MVCMTENKKLLQDIDKKSLSILLGTDIRDRRPHIEIDNIHSFCSSEISPTRCNNCVFILRNGFTLHVSGDNLTHIIGKPVSPVGRR